MTNTPSRALPSNVEELRAALGSPTTHAYNYPDGWRFDTGGREINGTKPREIEPLYSWQQIEQAIARASTPTEKEKPFLGENPYDHVTRNARVQNHYDELMRAGKHGHYETMFRIVKEEVDRARSASVTDAGLPGALTPTGIAHRQIWTFAYDIAFRFRADYSVPGKEFFKRAKTIGILLETILGTEEARDGLESARLWKQDHPDEHLVEPPTPPAHGEGELRGNAANPSPQDLLAGVKYWAEKYDNTAGPCLWNVAAWMERALSHAPSPPQQDGSGLVEAEEVTDEALAKVWSEELLRYDPTIGSIARPSREECRFGMTESEAVAAFNSALTSSTPTQTEEEA